MTIQPIETRYAGCRFRSRLEARWAVFFDVLGIRWQYEPQGFHVGPRRRPYLPDFHLPALGWWIEVKGDHGRLDAKLLTDAVHPRRGLGRTDAFHHTNLLVLGDIPHPDVPQAHWGITQAAGPTCGGQCPFTEPRFGLWYFAPIPTSDDELAEAARKRLGALLLPAARTTPTTPTARLTDAVSIPQRGFVPATELAYAAARSARFEWGEAA